MTTISERIAYLQAVVGADITQFRKSMRDIRTETNVLSDAMAGLGKVGAWGTYAITTPLVALASYAVTAATAFDKSMRNINSIAFLTEGQLTSLSTRVIEFGKNTRSGSDEAAKALYEVFSAGITNTNDAFNIMEVSVKTAEAGLANLTTTTKGLTAAALSFGDQSPKAMQNYSDATTLAVQLGVGSMDVFNTGMQNVIGTGALMGVSFQNLAGSLAFLSQRGVQFSSAGTYLNQALAKLMKPTKDMDAMFTQLNVKSGKELLSTFGSFEGALRAIYSQIGNDEGKWAKLFPDVRAFKAIAPFLNSFREDGNDAVNTFFNNFNDKMTKGGVTAAAWEQQMKSFSAIVDKFKSAIGGVAIVIGNALLPIIAPVVEGFTGLLNGISSTTPETIRLGVAIAGAVAAFFPMVWVLASLATPMGLLIAGAGALAAAFYTNFGGIRDKVVSVVSEIGKILSPLTTVLKDLWDGVNIAMPTLDEILGTGGAATTAVNVSDWITVEKPTSLWQLYVDKGYDKMFSWDEFMKSAKASGWDGGALDIGDKIKLPDSGAMQTAANGMDTVARSMSGLNMATAKMELSEAGGKTSFLDRLATGIRDAWPKVKTALGTVWNSIVSWVNTTGIPMLDSAGGNVLVAIGNWFNPTANQGNSDTYKAMRNVFGGGAREGLASGVQALKDKFPNITAGLSAMFDHVSAWIQTEGVPTVSRGIGYLVGTMGAKLGELLGTLGSFMTGGGAGEAANGIKNSVADPAKKGFMDAMKDNGVKGGIDTLFTGLASLLVSGAGMSVFGLMLMGKGFGTAIMTTLGGVLSASFGAAKVLGKIGLGVAGKAFTGIGTVIMNSLTGSMETVALTGMVAFDNISKGIGTALKTALASSTAGQGILDAIGGQMSKASGVLTGATTWIGGVISGITGAIGAAFTAAPLLPVILSGIAIVGILALLLSPKAKEDMAKFFGDWFNPKNTNEMLNDPIEVTKTIDTLTLDVSTGVVEKGAYDAFDKITYFLNNRMQLSDTDKSGYSLALDKLVVDFKAGAIDQPAFDAAVQKLVSDAFSGVSIAQSSGEANAGGTAAGFLGSIVKAPPTAEAKKLADDMMNPVWVQVAANITAQSAAGGGTDTTVLASSMTKPFIDEFTLAFGSTGTVTTKWQEFINTFNTGMLDIGAKITETGMRVGLFSVGTILANTLAIASFNGYNGVKDKLGAVNEKAIELQNTLTSLLQHSPYEITIDIKTNGQMPTIPTSGGGDGTAGKTAATGLANVPFDGYAMSLHEGEAVLTETQAGVWRNLPRIMANAARAGANGGGEGKAQNNTIVINGVQDVDTLLKELDRRGIKIAHN